MAQAQERPKPRPVAASGDSGGNGLIARFRRYFDDVLSEMRKVAWPSREETRNLTLVVIGLSGAMGVFLGGIDFLLTTIYSFMRGNP